MMRYAEKPVLLVDGRKIERRGLHSISYVSEFARRPAADVSSARLEILVEERV
jgi:DeoR/GlpR family transcriptional regulator of sugar metabolism